MVANPLTGRVLLLFRSTTSAETLLQQLGIAVAPAPIPVAADGMAAADNLAKPGIGMPSEDGKRGDRYPPWHLRDVDKALAFHASSERSGLSRAEAEQRLRHGENRVELPKGRSSTDILLGQFKGGPVALLGASAVVSLVTGALARPWRLALC